MTSPQRQREIELAYLNSEQHRENLKRLGLVKTDNAAKNVLQKKE